MILLLIEVALIFIAGILIGLFVDHYYHVIKGDFLKGRGNYPKGKDE